MKFAYTILYVPDVVRASEFYQEAFNLEPGFVHPSKNYAELNTGPTKLAFVNEIRASDLVTKSYRKNSPSDAPAGFEVAFTCDDVQNAYDTAITGGAEPVKKPTDMPWGQKVAYVKDCHGILVEISSPMALA